MRVKITYSVDFEDVPIIVNNKLRAVAGELEKTGYALKTIESPSYLERLEEIDRIRKHLAGLDDELEDCYSILAGYNKALADMRVPQEQEEKEHDDGN